VNCIGADAHDDSVWGGAGDEDRYRYSCLDSRCYVTDHIYMLDALRTVVVAARGLAYVECEAPDANTTFMSCTVFRTLAPPSMHTLIHHAWADLPTQQVTA
jgi:hypothetical protein